MDQVENSNRCNKNKQEWYVFMMYDLSVYCVCMCVCVYAHMYLSVYCMHIYWLQIKDLKFKTTVDPYALFLMLKLIKSLVLFKLQCFYFKELKRILSHEQEFIITISQHIEYMYFVG